MIIGIGTDIVDVARIAGVYQRQGDAFAKRLLSPSELLDYTQHTHPERFLAKRWALKEAVSKALGTGISQGVCFCDMTIGHSPLGQPILTLANQTLAHANRLGITNWSVSVSDEKTHAVAFVIAEQR
ncbi:holo-ACP synthase [Thiomicrorhabdus aquaedulcis]|uniref:holo-ACP synthase n=1 Tax=Thiomicrorhabdus aquaedulcis TaxID=2211106 RepID=UPI000FDC2039|nr:holo-ACP synthase [Thiomicrorhabdus aquaedulcis]